MGTPPGSHRRLHHCCRPFMEKTGGMGRGERRGIEQERGSPSPPFDMKGGEGGAGLQKKKSFF